MTDVEKLLEEVQRCANDVRLRAGDMPDVERARAEQCAAELDHIAHLLTMAHTPDELRDVTARLRSLSVDMQFASLDFLDTPKH